MEFEDLLTDIDLECPKCNRMFQQTAKELEERDSVECPECGGAVGVKNEKTMGSLGE